MTDEQAERAIHELRLIRMALWAALIAVGSLITIQNIFYRPAIPPVVNVPAVGGR